jgi:hypothetical protein
MPHHHGLDVLSDLALQLSNDLAQKNMDFGRFSLCLLKELRGLQGKRFGKPNESVRSNPLPPALYLVHVPGRDVHPLGQVHLADTEPLSRRSDVPSKELLKTRRAHRVPHMMKRLFAMGFGSRYPLSENQPFSFWRIPRTVIRPCPPSPIGRLRPPVLPPHQQEPGIAPAPILGYRVTRQSSVVEDKS